MKLILQKDMYLLSTSKGQGDYTNSPPDIETIDNSPMTDEIGYVLEMCWGLIGCQIKCTGITSRVWIMHSTK